MAEKPVIVPVELQVTDVDISAVNLKDVQKDVNQKLAGLRKTIGDLFSGIDTSKMNKAITDSMASVEKSISKAITAQSKLDQAIIQAGRSSEVFKSRMAEVDSQIHAVQEQIKSLDSMNLGKAVKPVRDNMVKELEALEKQKASINPADFIDTAAPEAVLRVAEAYRKVSKAIEDVSSAGTQFNQTVDKNKLTDEYTKQSAKAEELKSQLEKLNEKSKKMAEVGATDKQWESLQYDVKKTSSEMDSTLRTMRNMVKEGTAFRFDAAEEDVKKLKNDIKSLNATRMSIAGNGKNKVGTVDARAAANTSPYTADYKKQLVELQRLETAAQKLIEKYERMKALGKDSPEGLKAAEYDAQQLSGKLEEARTKMTEMVNAGRAFKVGQGDPASEISGLNSRIDETQNNLSQVESKSNSLTRVFGRFVSKISEAHPAFGKVVAGAQKVGPVLSKIVSIGAKIGQVLGKGFAAAAKSASTLVKGLGRVAGKLGDIVSSAFKAVKNLNLFHKSGNKASVDLSKGFKKLQKNILMFGFGFRSAYYAIKRLRRIFTDAFKTLATQSNAVNSQISGLVMTLNRLKGSLATAFQPLATVVIPLLKATMNKLSDAMEVIGKFFATLTGQNYIYKATANQYDFAASLDETGKSAEEAKKKLGAYDKLDVIKDDNDKGSGSSNLLDVTYKKADVEGAVSDFAKLLKKSWEKQDFTAIGEVLQEKLSGLIDKLTTSVIPKFTGLVNKVTNSITTFFDGFDTKEFGAKASEIINSLISGLDSERLGAALGSLFSAFWEFADGLVNNIDWANVGNTIGNLIMGFIENFDAEAWIDTFVGLFSGIGQALINLVSTIKWDEVGTKFGSAIGNAINNIDPTTLMGGLANLLNGLMTTFVNLIGQIDFGEAAEKLAEGINAFIGGIDGSTFQSGLGGLISGIVQFASTLIENIDWNAIYEGLKTGIDGMLARLEESLGGSGVPVLETIGELIGAIREVLNTLWPVIEQVVSAISPIVQAILPVLSNILPPLAELIGNAVELVLPLLISLIETLMPIMEQIIMALLPALNKILTALQPLFDVLVQDVLPFIAEILDALMPLLQGVIDLVTAILAPVMQLLEPLLKLVVNILRPILDLLTPILDLIGYLFSAISMILEPILDLLTPLFEILNDILEPIFEVLGVIFDLLSPFIDIIKFIVGLITSVLEPVLNVLVGIFRVIADAVKMVGKVFKSVFEGIRDVLDKVWGFIKGILNGIISGIEGMANGVIKGLNFLIKGLNKISFDVPEWVPLIGGKKFGFNIKEISEVHIPRLAQGAVIPPNKEFLAMLGDQKSGTNVEAPLDTIKQALAEVLAEAGSVGGHEPIILQLDGKTVAKVVWAEEEKKYKQTGKVSAYA